MNKATSPTGNNANSPETSDSQGFYEESSTSTLTRATKNWKKIREISEIEVKRPPWQIVGLSTLPKADKNAILRAKLLDASRRMRLGKSGIGVQTDAISTKLMKEANTDIQNDLIEMIDVEILTDGAITLSKEGIGEFLLTHSVAQMTDVVQVIDAQTQTDTPRISNKFFEEYFSKRPSIHDGEGFEQSLTKTEKKLLHQIKEIRQIEEQLDGDGQQGMEPDSELSDDSLLDDDNDDIGFHLHYKKFLRRKSYKRPKNFLKPTIPAWRFDSSDFEDLNLYNSQRRCFTESNRPCSSFNDVMIDNKLANMKLVPVPVRKSSIKKKTISWSDAQHNAVVDLINEANALLDVFEEIAMLLGPDIKLNDLPEKEDTQISFLSEYWDPILKKSAHTLDEKMNTLQNLSVKKLEPITPEMLEKVL